MKSFKQHLTEAVTPQEYQQGAENLKYSDPERAAYYASMAVSRGKQFAKLDNERARQTRIAEYGPGLKGILRSLFASRSSRIPGNVTWTVEAGLPNKNTPGTSEYQAFQSAAALPRDEQIARHAAYTRAARLSNILGSSSTSPAVPSLRQLDQLVRTRAGQGLGGAQITTTDGVETKRKMLVQDTPEPKFFDIQGEQRKEDARRAREDRAAAKAAKPKK